MKKILILAGDAVEAQEIFYPYYRLKEEGFEVKVAGPKKEPLYTVVHDFEPGWTTYTEKPGYRFPWVDMTFKEVSPEEFDGLVIPGGRMPEYIRLDENVERVIKHFFEANKPIAAICHGPLLFIHLGLAKGRKMTSYIAIKPDVIAGGAEYLDEEVVVDGNLVTSRAWPDLPSFMKKFIELLKEK